MVSTGLDRYQAPELSAASAASAASANRSTMRANACMPSGTSP